MGAARLQCGGWLFLESEWLSLESEWLFLVRIRVWDVCWIVLLVSRRIVPMRCLQVVTVSRCLAVAVCDSSAQESKGNGGTGCVGVEVRQRDRGEAARVPAVNGKPAEAP